jgi:hypothetical protein
MSGWMNGNEFGIDDRLTRLSRHIKLRAATNRKTPCHWVTIMGVQVLFSYGTAMAFVTREGSFRREDGISSVTKRHLDETQTWSFDKLEDDAFELALDRAVVSEILRNQKVFEEIFATAVANKLLPEPA